MDYTEERTLGMLLKYVHITNNILLLSIIEILLMLIPTLYINLIVISAHSWSVHI